MKAEKLLNVKTRGKINITLKDWSRFNSSQTEAAVLWHKTESLAQTRRNRNWDMSAGLRGQLPTLHPTQQTKMCGRRLLAACPNHLYQMSRSSPTYATRICQSLTRLLLTLVHYIEGKRHGSVVQGLENQSRVGSFFKPKADSLHDKMRPPNLIHKTHTASDINCLLQHYCFMIL